MMIELPILDITDTRRPLREPVIHDSREKRSTSAQDWTYDNSMSSGYPMEADPFNVLVLNYTMKCALACDFCCYACNPGRKETMSLDLALNLVDQAADLGVFAQGGFTGGEPLLFEEEILQVAKRMCSNSMPYSMISSCYWATDDRQVNRVLDSLAQTGLSVFSISYDPSHGEWVDQDNVRRVVDKLVMLGIPAVVCASFYDARQHLKDKFPQYDNHPGVELVDRVVLPVGLSKNKALTPESYGVTNNQLGLRCYKRAYHDLTVFWDGEVYPCCSVYNRATKGLSLGNAYDSPLSEIWDRVQGSLMYRVMKSRGFSEVYRIIEERAPELAARLPRIDAYLGPCELCHHIFSDKSVSRDVKSIFSDLEVENLSRVIANLPTESAG